MKRTAFSVLFVAMLMCALTLVLDIRPAKSKWFGTVYIRADGSIDPPGAPIETLDNMTYILTDDILGSIKIEKDDIIVNGSDHLIETEVDAPYYYGIVISERKNITIQNTVVRFGTGIYIYNSSNISIIENNLTNNYFGIALHNSSNNSMIRNILTDHLYVGAGIYLEYSQNNRIEENVFIRSGLRVWESYGNIVSNNTVNGKPLIYLEDVSDRIIKDAGQVVLVKCNHITIENLNIANTSASIQLFRTNNTKIIECNITNNYCGVELCLSSNISISKNNIKANEGAGIQLIQSSNTKISENNIKENFDSISLEGSSYNEIDNNDIDAGIKGIFLTRACYNIVANNTITRILEVGSIMLYGALYNTIQSNTIMEGHGLWLWSSANNTIIQNSINTTITANWRGHFELSQSSDNVFYHNNFFINKDDIFVYNSMNVWDAGYPSGGNYWSDYVGIDEKSGPGQDQPGSDGIGDTPYVINENNIDRYPLMEPISPPTHKFIIGDVVWATADLHVREGPGLSYAILDTMRKGNRGVIIAGPVEADGYTWWRVNYSVGVVGWSAEDWLEPMPSPPQPPRDFVYWAEAAVNWAEQRLGRGDWSGLCMQFVANAYMQEEHKEAKYNAIDGAREFYRFNQEPNGWLQAPKGALIFFDMEGTNEYGHVGIYLGNGSIIHAYGTVKVNTVEEAVAKPDVGRYLGWSYPAEQWRPTKFTFNATYDGVNYPVAIFTNSTIMNFAFHQPSKQISFTVYGEPGETGYCNITIPKALLKGEPWAITLNGTNWSYIATENETHSFIYITYTFSSAYEVTIEGTWVIPEFPLNPVMLLVLTTLTAVILSRRRARH
ncbi:MAG: NosD domain-containing protein [Candidatus Bathyarchaeia archaeon]